MGLCSAVGVLVAMNQPITGPDFEVFGCAIAKHQAGIAEATKERVFDGGRQLMVMRKTKVVGVQFVGTECVVERPGGLKVSVDPTFCIGDVFSERCLVGI